MCFLLSIFVCFLGGLSPLCLSIHAYAFLNGNFIGIALVLSLSFAIGFPYVYCQIKLEGAKWYLVFEFALKLLCCCMDFR